MFPQLRQPARPERGHAVGRGAADGRPRSGADGRPRPAARRRAVDRAGAQGRRELFGVVRSIGELGTTVIIVEQSVADALVGGRHGDVHGEGRGVDARRRHGARRR